MQLSMEPKKPGIEQAVEYISEGPEKNLPRLTDWADKFARDQYGPQRDAIRDYRTASPSAPWTSRTTRNTWAAASPAGRGTCTSTPTARGPLRVHPPLRLQHPAEGPAGGPALSPVHGLPRRPALQPEHAPSLPHAGNPGEAAEDGGRHRRPLHRPPVSGGRRASVRQVRPLRQLPGAGVQGGSPAPGANRLCLKSINACLPEKRLPKRQSLFLRPHIPFPFFSVSLLSFFRNHAIVVPWNTMN